MFDIAFGMGTAKAILVANKLGVFEKLSGRSLSALELAKELGGDEQGYSKLLEPLVSLGYLRRSRNGNT
jgi:DNA-binding IclR family transcriptional regulator